MTENRAISPAFLEFRSMMLNLKSGEIGITPENFPYKVFGLLMETGMPEGMFTLACLADGTTSLYLSDGSGTIGAGQYEAVRAAAEYLLAGAQHYLNNATPVSAFPMTDAGMVRFYFLTAEQVLAYQALEEDLYEGRDELSKLFFAAHAVLTELRTIEQEFDNP